MSGKSYFDREVKKKKKGNRWESLDLEERVVQAKSRFGEYCIIAYNKKEFSDVLCYAKEHSGGNIDFLIVFENQKFSVLRKPDKTYCNIPSSKIKNRFRDQPTISHWVFEYKQRKGRVYNSSYISQIKSELPNMNLEN